MPTTSTAGPKFLESETGVSEMLDTVSEITDSRRDGHLPGKESLWARYLSLSEKSDEQFVNDLRSVSDGILVFTGLFAAVVAQFISQTYPLLTQAPADQSTVLLLQISQQLSTTFNSTPASVPQSLSEFSPPAYAIQLNALWFLSLIFSLFAAFMATLVQSWARTYQRTVDLSTGPLSQRGLLHTCLYAGVKRSGLTYSVDAVVLLLNISVILFAIGLAVLAASLNSTIALIVRDTLYVCLAIYASMSLVPVVIPECPYATPLTPLFRVLAGIIIACGVFLGASERIADILMLDMPSVPAVIMRLAFSRRAQLRIQSRLRSAFRFEHVAGRLVRNVRTPTDARDLLAVLPALLASPLLHGRSTQAWHILLRQNVHYVIAWVLQHASATGLEISPDQFTTLAAFSTALAASSKRADPGLVQLAEAWSHCTSDADAHITLAAQCALGALRAQFAAYADPSVARRRAHMLSGRRTHVFHPDGDIACAHKDLRTALLAGDSTPDAHLPAHALVAFYRAAATASSSSPPSNALRTTCVRAAHMLADSVVRTGSPSSQQRDDIEELFHALEASPPPIPTAERDGIEKINTKMSSSHSRGGTMKDIVALLTHVPELRAPLQRVADAFRARQSVRRGPKPESRLLYRARTQDGDVMDV